MEPLVKLEEASNKTGMEKTPDHKTKGQNKKLQEKTSRHKERVAGLKMKIREKDHVLKEQLTANADELTEQDRADKAKVEKELATLQAQVEELENDGEAMEGVEEYGGTIVDLSGSENKATDTTTPEQDPKGSPPETADLAEGSNTRGSETPDPPKDGNTKAKKPKSKKTVVLLDDDDEDEHQNPGFAPRGTKRVLVAYKKSTTNASKQTLIYGMGKGGKPYEPEEPKKNVYRLVEQSEGYEEFEKTLKETPKAENLSESYGGQRVMDPKTQTSRCTYSSKHLSSILAVAWEPTDAARPLRDLDPKVPRKIYKKAYIKCKWNIDGEWKYSWELRTTLRRVFKAKKEQVDQEIFDCAKESEMSYDEIKRNMRSRSKTPGTLRAERITSTRDYDDEEDEEVEDLDEEDETEDDEYPNTSDEEFYDDPEGRAPYVPKNPHRRRSSRKSARGRRTGPSSDFVTRDEFDRFRQAMDENFAKLAALIASNNRPSPKARRFR